MSLIYEARMAALNRMNFRKSSKGGKREEEEEEDVIFNPKNMLQILGTLSRDF